jgi:hypothetical protein
MPAPCDPQGVLPGVAVSPALGEHHCHARGGGEGR